MTITNGYCTLAQIKARLGIPTATTSEDALLEEAVQSASREIDKYCHRRFYVDASTSARVYFPDSECRLTVEDFSTITGLSIAVDYGNDGAYETTLTTSDYQLYPLNGIVDGESGWPFSTIEMIGAYRLPARSWSSMRPSVQVTAKWGWAAVPDPVYQACLIMAQANYKLKDSAFGSVGIGELGIVTVRQTPAAMVKLAPYRLDPVLVG